MIHTQVVKESCQSNAAALRMQQGFPCANDSRRSWSGLVDVTNGTGVLLFMSKGTFPLIMLISKDHSQSSINRAGRNSELFNSLSADLDLPLAEALQRVVEKETTAETFLTFLALSSPSASSPPPSERCWRKH